MQTEQDVIFAQNEEMIGRKLSVIVDGYLPEDGVYVGRYLPCMRRRLMDACSLKHRTKSYQAPYYLFW